MYYSVGVVFVQDKESIIEQLSRKACASQTAELPFVHRFRSALCFLPVGLTRSTTYSTARNGMNSRSSSNGKQVAILSRLMVALARAQMQ